MTKKKLTQPLVEDENNILRFKENAIVRTLLDESTERGYSLNNLARGDFSQDDWEQFYQLIGYSVCGYHELSLVSDESAALASKEAKKIHSKAGGCRDHECEIHVGVKSE